MTREKIISLARECDPRYMDSYGVALVGVVAVEAFYHAAQAEAFEAAAKLCDKESAEYSEVRDSLSPAENKSPVAIGILSANRCAAAIREMAKEMK